MTAGVGFAARPRLTLENMTMHWLLTTALLGTLAQPALTQLEPGLRQASIDVECVGTVTFGIWVPRNYDPDEPRPLVLALHPGGSTGAGYGAQFLRGIVAPALQDWGAIIVSPDAPGRGWDNDTSERAVLALLDDIRGRATIDPEQILVTGFSMGGRGTWYMASRHPDLFKAAIPMAARSNSEDAGKVGGMPVFIIHARDDELVPFGPAEALAQEMEKQGQNVSFLALDGVGHFRMGVAPLIEGGEWVMQQWGEQ